MKGPAAAVASFSINGSFVRLADAGRKPLHDRFEPGAVVSFFEKR